MGTLAVRLGAGKQLVEEEVLVGSVITRDTISRREERYMPPGHAIRHVAFPSNNRIRRQVVDILRGVHVEARGLILRLSIARKMWLIWYPAVTSGCTPFVGSPSRVVT